MKILIYHGLFTKTNEDWFQTFKVALETDEVEVIIPQYPLDIWTEISEIGEEKAYSLTNTNQNLRVWTEYFEKEVLPLLKDEEQIWIGHSTGCVFMLHLLLKYDIKLKGSIFVSPFLNKIPNGRWQMNFGNSTFYSNTFDFEKIKPKLGQSYVLYSKTDPYIPNQYSIEFGNSINSSILPINEGDHLGSTFQKLPLVEELAKSIVGFGKYFKNEGEIEFKSFNAFTDNEGNFGNAVQIIIDESHSRNSAQRQEYAIKSGVSEVVFINSIEKCNISIFSPTGEVPFAGPAVLGAVWYLNKLKNTRITSLFSMIANIDVRYEAEKIFVKAHIITLPPWNLKEYSSPHEIDAIKLEDTTKLEHCMVWSWMDKEKGTIRSRTFAPDWLIPEDDANGSGSMLLASKLGRSITVYQAKGSIIHANYIDSEFAEVGGDFNEKTLQKQMFMHDQYSKTK